MKKNILFVFASVFVITIKACENKALFSIQSPNAGLYAETRGENKELTERIKTCGMLFHFRKVTLTLLDPKVMLLSENDGNNENDGNKTVQLLKLEKNQYNVELRATLIDDKMMDRSVQGLLLALFPSDAFVRGIEGQVKNKNVYFKISGEYTQQGHVSEFYFSVPSEKIISDFGLQQSKSEKYQVSEENSDKSNHWIRYAIPFGLLAILTVWYFKYKS